MQVWRRCGTGVVTAVVVTAGLVTAGVVTAGVVIMCLCLVGRSLGGAAIAGDGGNREAIVVALAAGPSASLSIAGAAAAAPMSMAGGRMATLSAGAAAPVLQPMPGTMPPAAAAAEAAVVGSGVDLRQLGSGLVLLLGAALVVAPATVLGSFLHTGSDTIFAALLECGVYGYILLQVWGRGASCEGTNRSISRESAYCEEHASFSQVTERQGSRHHCRDAATCLSQPATHASH
eukprot:135942-Chlamydomonas_euryale.AAC.4